jgi:hypothetical protein
MQPAASWDPAVERRRGTRDVFVAGLALALGAGLVVSVLTHVWPQALLPASTGRPDYAYNIRLLKLLILVEGALLGALGLAVAWRGAWLRRLDGVEALDRHAGVALAVLVAAHAVALGFYFPPQQIVADQPVHTGSHAAHFYRIFAAHRLLDDGIHLWGYDPFFMAGYPAGAVFDPDTRGSELFTHAFSFIGLAYASKAYILLVQLGVPLFVYAAARLLGLGRGAAALATLLALVHWHWGRPFLGYLRWVGMHSYLLATLLAVLGTGLAVRFHDPDHRVRVQCWAGLVIVAAVIGFVHPEGLLLLAPGVVLAYGFGARRLRRRDHAALGIGLVLLVALHSTWIEPLVRQRHLLSPPAPGMQLHGAGDLLDLVRRPTSAPLAATLLLAGFGLWRLHRREPLAARTVAGATLWLLVVAALGAWLGPLRRLETARALVPATLLLVLPAGAALQTLLRVVQRPLGGTFVLLGLVVACSLPAFLSLVDTRFFYAHRLDATLPTHLTELLAGLDRLAPRDARMLFESTTPPDAGTDGMPLQALVPIYTRRELLGGPQPDMLPLQARFDFGAGALAGRPLADWSSAGFDTLLQRYNIGAAVAWSPAARAFLARQARSMTRVATLYGFDLYTVERPAGWLSGGTGRVRADYDRIELVDLQGDELVLKYHWIDGLQSTPPVPLERVAVPADPVGFIGVRPQGHTHLVLRPGR